MRYNLLYVTASMGSKMFDVICGELDKKEETANLSIMKICILKTFKLIKLYLFKPYIIIIIVL